MDYYEDATCNTLSNKVINELSSITDFLRWGYSYINSSDVYCGHGYTNLWDECLSLVLNALNLPQDTPTELYDGKLLKYEKEKILQFFEKRIQEKIPTAYLTNQAMFCDLWFYVDERVIIPRSPIAELIKNKFMGITKAPPKKILDLCTGSGCIAIACAMNFPDAEIDATDISIDALNVTEYNIESYNLLDKIVPIKSDLFNNLSNMQYDLIIANPPYVDQEDIDHMPAEFIHEPTISLQSGNDGLNITKRILAEASHYLSDDGVLICEVGNSMVNLIEQFPHIEFNWIALESGGIGVFSLTKKQLAEHQSEFIRYI